MDRGYRTQEHACVKGTIRTDLTWWAVDGHGIELCRVCSECEDEKLARYRPDIMDRYDADEQIEEEA